MAFADVTKEYVDTSISAITDSASVDLTWLYQGVSADSDPGTSEALQAHPG